MTSPISGLLDARVARDAAAPLITYYDDDTGERTELSATTLHDWTVKTANLLQDGLDVEPGHRVAVLLEPHWQAAAVLLGAWAVGAVVTERPPAQVLITSAARIPEFQGPGTGRIGAVVGLSLDPLVRPMQPPPAGTTDFADALLYGDVFAPHSPVDPAAGALVAGSLTLTGRGVVATATELASRLTLAPGDRLLVDAEQAREAGPVAWLLAPLAAGASIVLCRHPDPIGLRHRATTERVTVTMGRHVDGVRAAGG